MQRLNTSPVLYNAVVKMEQSNALTTEEAKRAAHSHRVEFERGGVHLSDGQCANHTDDRFKVINHI